MKTKTARPVLYGPNGAALKPSAYGLYPTPRFNIKSYRPLAPASVVNRFRSALSGYDRCELVGLSRQLFAQLGNLGTAIRDKNSWAFSDAWDVHYKGSNPTWGAVAESFLNDQFFPNCDRQGRHNWRALLKLSGMAWDRDGDDLMLLTEDDNGSGFPKVEFIEGTRIANGESGISDGDTISGGAFDGARIFEGIIVDGTGKPIGVRVVGEEEGEFEDYTLGYGGNADLAYQPEWVAQKRGIPLVARVVLDWIDLKDVDDFLKRGIKRAASVGLLSKTEEGEGGVGNEIITEQEVTDDNGDAHTVHYEEVEGGEMWFLRSSGESLEGLDYKTPHPNVEAFIARIERRGLAAVGWFYELLYLGESGRAATRLVTDLANQSIWSQQSIGERRTWRALRYALARAQKYGFLPRNADPMDAYFAWEIGLPKELSVDAGNDEQADRENLKVGTTNLSIIAQKKGRHWLAIRKQRKVEIIQNARDAEEITAASGGKISFERAMDLLEQRSANPVNPTQQQPQKNAKNAKE